MQLVNDDYIYGHENLAKPTGRCVGVLLISVLLRQ